LKTTLLIISLTVFSQLTNAQLKGFSIGPYAERAWPGGNFEKLYNNGIGVGVGADVKLPGNLGLTGSLGVLRFTGKEFSKDGVNEEIPALTATPIRVGIKYKLPLVYLKLEAGSAGMNDEKGGGMVFSPGAGIRILGLDVMVSYESWIRSNSYSFWGLRASYHF
jgi:hypothetical protein